MPIRRRHGFTLVELLVVVVLGAVIVTAVYRTLLAQEQTYRVSGAMIQDQETLRTALGILETELREAGSTGGASRGGSDILVAERDSVRFRAQRKFGVICYPHPSERWAYVAAVGEPFTPGDSLLIHVAAHDRWEPAVVESQLSVDASNCSGLAELLELSGHRVQRVKFAGHTLEGAEPGSAVRSVQTLTYGLYQFPDRGWGLGRHGPGERPKYVVGELAPPGEGLVLRYLGPDGGVASDTASIHSIRITMETAPGGTGAGPATAEMTVQLRN